MAGTARCGAAAPCITSRSLSAWSPRRGLDRGHHASHRLGLAAAEPSRGDCELATPIRNALGVESASPPPAPPVERARGGAPHCPASGSRRGRRRPARARSSEAVEPLAGTHPAGSKPRSARAGAFSSGHALPSARPPSRSSCAPPAQGRALVDERRGQQRDVCAGHRIFQRGAGAGSPGDDESTACARRSHQVARPHARYECWRERGPPDVTCRPSPVGGPLEHRLNRRPGARPRSRRQACRFRNTGRCGCQGF
jgi:hypothetical protein